MSDYVSEDGPLFIKHLDGVSGFPTSPPLFKCPECPHAVIAHGANGCLQCACRARRVVTLTRRYPDTEAVA